MANIESASQSRTLKCFVELDVGIGGKNMIIVDPTSVFSPAYYNILLLYDKRKYSPNYSNYCNKLSIRNNAKNNHLRFKLQRL